MSDDNTTRDDAHDRQMHPDDLTDRQLDDLLSALAIARRRRLLRYLAEQSRPVTVTELTAEMARSELSVAAGPSATTRDDVVRARLVHVDIPMLDQAGLVHHDSDRETVQLTELADLPWVRAIIEGTSSRE